MAVAFKREDRINWISHRRLVRMGGVTVLFFGAAADRAGIRESGVAVDAASTLEELWASLVDRLPDLEPMKRNLVFAVNQRFADATDRVVPGDEVALLPPVSGGWIAPPSIKGAACRDASSSPSLAGAVWGIQRARASSCPPGLWPLP